MATGYLNLGRNQATRRPSCPQPRRDFRRENSSLVNSYSSFSHQ
jgi:hypothetical protein